MPSASTTADSKAANNDPTEPIRQAVLLVEKKIRNLEKRKQKLDGTREKLKSGDVELNEDQKEAINRINVVEGNLELARELKGQFLQLQTDTEKAFAKQLKREKRERQLAEMDRFQSLLIVNDVLNNMGSDQVRADFKEGSAGAVKLSEDDLGRLDELHRLIYPERDEEHSFQDKLKTSSDHIVSLLDGKDKEVIGTTYKDLKTMTDSIYHCAYWSKTAEPEPSPETPAENGESVPEAPTPENEYVDAEDGLTPSEPISEQLVPDVATQQPISEQQPAVSSQPAPEESYYGAPKTRPFNEIVSSVQGNFNFLQDSEIDSMSMVQPEAACIDPAILHAQPRQMPPTHDGTLAGPGYPTQFVPEENQSHPQSQTFYNSMVHDPHTGQNLSAFNETPDKPEPIPLPGQNKLPDAFSATQPTTADSFAAFPVEGADDTVGDTKEGEEDGFTSWNRNNRGPRGRSQRGTNGQNGFRGGQRGGYGAPRGGRRGGAWQGMPARDNYRPEGYQGYQQRETREPRDGGAGRRGGASRGDGQKERGGRGGGFGGQRGGGGYGNQRGSSRGNRGGYQQQQQQQQQQNVQ